MNLADVKSTLVGNPWFADLPAEIVEQMVQLCVPRTLQTGQQLHARHDHADGLYCVIEGRIRVSNVNLDGKENVLTWLEPGTWFGEISLLDGLPRTHDAHAEEPSLLMMLPEHGFRTLLDSYPQLYKHFTRLLCQRLRATFALIDESSGLSLTGQLAKRLLLMASGLGQHRDVQSGQQIRVSQETLAHMLNSSRQTINKQLQQLQKEKVIEVKYGRITLLNPDRLVALSSW